MAVSSGGSNNNAIDAMAFVLHFDSPFAHTALQSVSPDLLDRLRYPRFDHVRMQRVDIQNGFSHVQQSHMAFPLWQKYRQDGRVVHELRCETESIVFLCTDYTRWDEVLPQALSDLKSLADSIASEKNVVKVSLQTTDKFTLDGTEKAFDSLLSANSRYLTQNIVQTESKLWHVHQGWFVDTEMGRCLNVLNTSVVENGTVMDVIIDHISDTGLNNPCSLRDLNIKALFDLAHDSNKKILLDLLQDQIKDTIGLK